MMLSMHLMFSLSSTIRHTRYWRDWSSDVCSSDLVEYANVIMDQAAAAMIGGTVGGAELWEPFGTQTLSAVPGAKVVASTADPEWAANALIADAHFINA